MCSNTKHSQERRAEYARASMIDFEKGTHKIYAVRKIFGTYQIQTLVFCRTRTKMFSVSKYQLEKEELEATEEELQELRQERLKTRGRREYIIGGLFKMNHPKACEFFIPIAEIRKNFFEEMGEAKERYEELMKPVLRQYRLGTNDEIRYVGTDRLKKIMNKNPVGEYSADGKCLKIYQSIIKASEERHVSAWSILNTAEGFIRTVDGTFWKYMCDTMPDMFHKKID